MTFNDYQTKALATALRDDDFFVDVMHWVLGLAGEAGEVADKCKKIIRDKNQQFGEVEKADLMAELGDVLWHIAVLGDELGFSLEDIAKNNIAKTHDRKRRGVIQGEGDNR